MAFRHYTETDLNQIINDPRRICTDPYRLLVAFLIDNLAELAEDELWGSEMPCNIVDRTLADSAADFKEAGLQGNTVRIKGNGYTIKRINTINWQNVPFIFQFPKNGDNYRITKDGVYNIKGEFLEDYDQRHEEFRRNQTFFHKVMWLSVQKDGWNKLTDMEAAMYCWATWVCKFSANHVVTQDNIETWWKKYYDYFCLPLKEIRSCFDDNITERMQFTTLCPFSHKKVAQWNAGHSQESTAEKVDETIADDYWFQTARKKYEFAPITQ